MDAIPLEAFEGAGEALLFTDSGGRIRMINQAAALLLGCTRESALGKECWKSSGLRYRNGAPFCGPTCPVRRSIADGNLRLNREWLIRPRKRGRALGIELFSFAIPENGEQKAGVLHVLAPVPATAPRGPRRQEEKPPHPAAAGARPAGGEPAEDESATGPDMNGALRRLQTLSPRECEILDLLAQGRPTRAIAESLEISANTVRNHVRGILEKLRVHRRLEAVLVWLMRGRKH